MIEYFGPTSNDKTSGFTGTPFGSGRFKKYWTIKGANSDKPKYECGSEHNYMNGVSDTQLSPNMVETHHTVWFRGNPPTTEQAQRRFISKMRSSNFN